MSFIIGVLIAAKSIVFVGGLFAFGRTQISIEPPRIVVTQEEISMDCRVKNAYTRDLRKLAETGTEIPLYLFVEMRTPGEDEPLAEALAESRLSYDPIGRRYVVVTNPGSDTAIVPTLDSAMVISTAFDNMRVVQLGQIQPDMEYYFLVYGVLGKARVEALGSNRIDLMYYWNYKRPAIATQRYEGGVFLDAGRREGSAKE